MDKLGITSMMNPFLYHPQLKKKSFFKERVRKKSQITKIIISNNK